MDLKLLSPETVANYLGISIDTLAHWRSTRRYNLPHIKVGRYIRYRQKDVEDWLKSRTEIYNSFE